LYAGHEDGGVWDEESFGREFWSVGGVDGGWVGGGLGVYVVEDGQGEERGGASCAVRIEMRKGRDVCRVGCTVEKMEETMFAWSDGSNKQKERLAMRDE